MPRFPGVNHQRAIRAFARAGFRIKRQGRHIIMTNDEVDLIIPRNNPVDAYTMGSIIARAGLTVSEFRELL